MTVPAGYLCEALGPACGNDYLWQWVLQPVGFKHPFKNDEKTGKPIDYTIQLMPEKFEVISRPCSQHGVGCEAPTVACIHWPGKGWTPCCLEHLARVAKILDVLGINEPAIMRLDPMVVT